MAQIERRVLRFLPGTLGRWSRWLDDGSYELQVPYSEPTELVMDILRHGDSVRVVGDKALVASIAERLRQAARLYA